MGSAAPRQQLKRSVVEGFYKTQASRDPERIAPFLDDDVEWSISGPVDLLCFCGIWRGKQAALEIFTRLVPQVFDVIGFEQDELLIDGESVATLNRLSAIQCATGRRISYRVAQFLRFRDGKIVNVRALLDSFNAAEQVLGYRITLAPDRLTRVNDSDLIAI